MGGGTQDAVSVDAKGAQFSFWELHHLTACCEWQVTHALVSNKTYARILQIIKLISYALLYFPSVFFLLSRLIQSVCAPLDWTVFDACRQCWLSLDPALQVERPPWNCSDTSGVGFSLSVSRCGCFPWFGRTLKMPQLRAACFLTNFTTCSLLIIENKKIKEKRANGLCTLT